MTFKIGVDGPPPDLKIDYKPPETVTLQPAPEKKEKPPPRLAVDTGAPSLVRIALRDLSGAPLAGKAYELKLGDQVFNGTVSDVGLIEEGAPAGTKTGELVVYLDAKKESKLKWSLQIGALDTIDTVKGVQQRLKAFFFYGGPVNGVLTEETKAAVRAFEEFLGKEPSGDPAGIKDPLAKLHDGA